jgi:PHP family Zn ribbon phosphoesterase
MTTTDTRPNASSDPLTPPAAPPVPELAPLAEMPLPCIKDSRRHQDVRRYAERLVAKVGPTVALWIAAELDEAAADAGAEVGR